jgi:hypothetical protein
VKQSVATLFFPAIVAGVVLALSPSWAASGAHQQALDEAAPMGLTAELDDVPTLAPLSIPMPYQMDWQKRLLAFQQSFETNLQHKGPAQQIDLIETGSINEAR